MRKAFQIATVVGLLLLSPTAAHASWPQKGAGKGSSKATTLPTGNTPAATVTGRSVALSWSPSSISGGSIDGYVIRRYNAEGIEQSIGSACSGTIAGTSCTERAVPAGTWRYSVTPALGSWRGATSSKSTAVTIGSPKLTVSPSTITKLPSTLTGELQNFIAGQTVSFRLDNPTSGQSLTGSITPTPVPASGAASVSVTIPTGVTSGSHTVYAIGNQGDQASAAFTYTEPTTITTSAWDLRDASSGTEQNSSQLTAFNDERAYEATGFSSAFSTSRYFESTYNSPLASSVATSAVTFDFRFKAGASGDVACFYFDVISGGSTIGTHGSTTPGTATSTWCTGSTYKLVSTPLPEITSGAVANGVQIKVYGYESKKKPVVVDLATVSGTASSQSFTLQAVSQVDASSGTPTTIPWGLASSAADNAFYTSLTAWTTTYSTSRFIKVTFPGYVPSTASLTGVTFSHSYRPVGGTACFYFQVYAGASLIGTHGSSASPFSCNSSSLNWVTDSIELPEVTTAAQANSLSVKMYFSNTASGKTSHDLATLSLSYVP